MSWWKADVGVDRRRARLVLDRGRGTGRGHQVTAALHHGAEVLGGGAAAAAHDAHAELGDEALEMVGQLVRGQVVVHLAVHHRGQARVGLRRDGQPGVLAQVADGLAHLGRARGAVEPDDVGAHGVEGGERGADLGAREHAARELDGDLDLQRHAPAGRDHGALGRVDGGLGLEEVVDGLDEDEVDAAGDERGRLFLVGVAQARGRGSGPGWGTGAGAEVARHPAGPSVAGGRGGLVGGLAGQAGRGQVDLLDAVLEAVLGQDDPEGPEGVGLDHVAADVEEGPVDGLHHVGPVQDHGLAAALEGGPAVVLGAQVGELQAGAHGAVEDHDPGPGGLEVGGAALVHGQGAVRQHRRRSRVGVHGRGHDPHSLRPVVGFSLLAEMDVPGAMSAGSLA